MSAQDHFNKEDYQECSTVLKDVLLDITDIRSVLKMVDYAADALDIVVAEYNKKLHGLEDDGLELGWPSFDNQTGGLVGGDVVSFIGRPAMGKSYQMLYCALHAWDSGKVPLFFSMEMKPLSILQRLTAMDSSIPITQLKRGELSTTLHGRMTTKLESNKNKNPFWVVDGALTATMDDIELLAMQLSPDVIFIDGAYLIRNKNYQAQRWDRLTYIAEGIKQNLAEDMNLPVVISYQFNRQAENKPKNREVSLADIAYTDAIGQLSSVVLGILEDENVETLKRRKIKILKGRDGQTGEFLY